jgi:alcohol dehydrogenase (cytochrome c)
VLGLLSTAGNVLFTGGSGGLEALNATTGDALWYSRIGNVTNAPITYELDGEQHAVVATGNSMFSFVMNK